MYPQINFVRFYAVSMTTLPQHLITTRFDMRLRALSDLDDLLDLDDDADVIRYVGPTLPRAQREVDWRQVFETESQRPVLCIRDRITYDFKGWAFLRPYKDDSGDWELGYRLKKAAWAQGIGTEVSRILIKWGWSQPDIHTIVAVYEAQNTASLNIMIKLGMKPMGLRHYPNEGPLPYCAMTRPIESAN
jgi:RimJ/RimL family protein N-acetyltransferase